MKNLIGEFLNSKNSKINGLIAICILSLFVMGCMCGKGFDFGNLAEDNKNASNQSPKSGDDNKSDNQNGKDDSGDSGKKTNPFDTPTPRKPSTTTSSGDTPSRDEAAEIVKETMSDFADGVDGEDFTILRSKAAPEFQSEYSAERVKIGFQDFINKKDMAVPILRKASNSEPIFVLDPWISKQGSAKILELGGSFPTSPDVRFNNKYLWSGGKWKLIRIEVRMN